jgi:Xaa-Pro aminopeptidase
VYYLTNYWAINARQGALEATYAVLPRDSTLPIALVLSEFSYYYTAADHALPPGVQLYLYSAASAPPEREGTAYEPTSFFRVAPDAPPPAREEARRARTRAASRAFGSRTLALQAALRDLNLPVDKGGATVVGIDDLAAQRQTQLVRAGSTVVAEDTLRRIRLVKTPAEIDLMRLASANNVAAALATARQTRELGTMRAFRAQFHAEAAARGNSPVFMVIDGVTSDAYDTPLVDGSAFMIDCVTQLRGYHGDFARTIFVGEPRAPMKRVTEAMSVGWDAVREQLKPGLKFSEITQLGRTTIRKLGYDHTIPFAPHSVGLWHTDQPRAAPDGSAVDVVLEENMILSVDCPLMETGRGGSAHLEDLMLITRTGAEPIHPIGHRTLVV